MGLSSYKQKRNFKETSEPKGKLKKTKDTLLFVIQKHHASHLHYDFRLEIDGVLKSWAVPKGPSLNPNDKRLAVMVEDHPFEYKDFEGVIPKGNYGAGNVIIWDEGTYEPAHGELSDDNNELRRQLRKGHLSIIMHGKKLRGEFALIKIRNAQRGDNAWLLIKKNDRYASNIDILKKNKSVRSRKTIESMDKKKIQTKSKLPQSIKPMLAKLIDQPFNAPDWIFEIKWDGFRILAFVDGKKVQLISRHQQNYSDIFLPVAQELAKLNIQAIFDGEMVVVDKEGRSRFQLLQQYQKNQHGNLRYFVFDLLWHQGQDLQKQPLFERKQKLEKILPPLKFIQYSEHIEEKGIEFFKSAVEHNLEGVMAKKINSIYKSGVRSSDWLKIKTKHRQEAIIAGFTEPRGSRKEIGALILAVYKKGTLTYIGHSGSGLTSASIHELKKKLDKLVQKQSPFEHPPKTNMPVTWVKPKLICEIAFTEWTDEGHMRHPIYIGLREDKSTKQVVKEMAIKSHEETSESYIINKHRIKISNPNKIFWPEEGYTKKDLVDYYRSVAKYILPYLKDRPESMLRHPEGISGFKFFQKNYEHAPSWIKTIAVHSEHEEREINYILCQNEATLIYMVNLGCIEINPWLSRYKKMEYPDFCLLDLDPEEIEFEAVVETALTIKKYLDELAVPCYCKTSGATGLHICIPLNAKYNYEQSRQFAELMVTEVNQIIPDFTSILRSPQKRKGKVYLDFLQNHRGQTITAPYAVRPRPGAPVSTPLHWKEVNTQLDPRNFTIETTLQRLQKVGDIWKPVMQKGINLEKVLKKLK